MKGIDFRSVDGQLLLTFLMVLEENSVTKAARRLGVTQSSVSHALARLRVFFGDPLFVRSGQSLQPTERALELRASVQAALDALEALTHERAFNPGREPLSFVVAANDMQRDLIFPELLRDIDKEGLSIAFEFIPSGHPSLEMLRHARCHLALTPFPPDGTDVIRKPILNGEMMCFYDGSVRDAPATWADYCSADHLAVRFPDGGTSLRALAGVDKSEIREAHVSVPNFNGIPPFIKGTRMVATELDLNKLCVLRDLDMAPLPMPTDRVSIFMCWHRRSTNDPAHGWLRGRIEKIASDVMGMPLHL